MFIFIFVLVFIFMEMLYLQRGKGFAFKVFFHAIFEFLHLQLWITRIEAASLEHGLKYPAFISNLLKVRMWLGG